MRERLRAGIAVYNVGEFHAAHDAWELRWLELEHGTDDERLLHGLIQYTAAVYHAVTRNWAGTIGLAESGRAYLAELPATYRGVDVDRAREYLYRLERDPERIERAPPWPLVHEGEQVRPANLDAKALGIAALTVAEGYDDEPIARAVDRLSETSERTEETAADEARRLRALLEDLVADDENRGVVHERLAAHVDRLDARDRDVEGLFEDTGEENGR